MPDGQFMFFYRYPMNNPGDAIPLSHISGPLIAVGTQDAEKLVKHLKGIIKGRRRGRALGD